MKIIKEGNLDFSRRPLRFECENCKTIFEADKDEYQFVCDFWRGRSYYVCECPLCHENVRHN